MSSKSATKNSYTQEEVINILREMSGKEPVLYPLGVTEDAERAGVLAASIVHMEATGPDTPDDPETQAEWLNELKEIMGLRPSDLLYPDPPDGDVCERAMDTLRKTFAWLSKPPHSRDVPDEVIEFLKWAEAAAQ